MTRIIIDRHRVSLEYETDCLLIRARDESPRSVPLQRLSQLVCMHSVTLTTQLIGQLHKRGIDLIVLNQRHSAHSFALYANQQSQVERRCRQYKWQYHSNSRLPFAVELCRHKFKVLERLLREFENTNAARERISASLERLDHCPSEHWLRGAEGAVQRLAFEHWRSHLPPELEFRTRQRRPPPDPVNAALSLTYTLVHHEAVRQALKHGLDPQLGFYHRTAYARQSLACDLMEPVRPHVEYWVVSMFNDGRISRRHFTKSQAGCLLGKQGRETFYEQYNEKLDVWRRQLDSTARWVARRLDTLEEKAA